MIEFIANSHTSNAPKWAVLREHLHSAKRSGRILRELNARSPTLEHYALVHLQTDQDQLDSPHGSFDSGGNNPLSPTSSEMNPRSNTCTPLSLSRTTSPPQIMTYAPNAVRNGNGAVFAEVSEVEGYVGRLMKSRKIAVFVACVWCMSIFSNAAKEGGLGVSREIASVTFSIFRMLHFAIDCFLIALAYGLFYLLYIKSSAGDATKAVVREKVD